MNKPKVSVIVPIYNAEKYLRQCLDSIANQTLRDLEIICVNDGSTDGSLDIIREYAARDERFVVIDKPNAGYGHSMNMGMDAATGEYMGIVDSDDYILPEMYKTLYDYAEQSDLDIARGAYYKFYEIGGKEQKTYWPSMGNKYCYRVYCPRREPEFWTSAVLTPSGIYRIDFLRKNGIRYNESPGAAFQDHGFWFKTQLLADRILFIKDAFYLYRFDNPDSSIYKASATDIMGKEYDYIKEFVDANPQLAYIAVPFYWKARFINSKVTYGRDVRHIGVETVGAFRDPFLKAEQSGELDYSMFKKDQLKSLQQLLKSPDAFCKKYKTEKANEAYKEHINWIGEKKSLSYQFQWYVKHFGLGYAVKSCSKKARKRWKKALKKKIVRFGKKKYVKKIRNKLVKLFRGRRMEERAKQAKLNAQLAGFLNAQKNLNARKDEVFWWSIHQPGETMTETKERFFLGLPKAEGSLRERQKEYAAVLSALKKLLNDNGIVFWPMGGTMVGMLRHKGFIPWDDDIDISMMYEDKQRLFDLVQNSPDLRIEEVYWCDPKQVLRCPRVLFKDPNRTGLVDIFLWERANEEPTGYSPLWTKRNQYVAKINAEYLKIKPKLHKIYRGEAVYDPGDKEKLEGIFDTNREACIQACGTGGTTIYGAVDMWFQGGRWKAVYAREDVYPMRPAMFEGEEYTVPQSAEQFLTDQYGDWMAIPGKVTPNHGG